jgi:NADP-dependent alcohol dehydrogenase
MRDFEFYNPVKILFGKEQVSRIRDLIPLNSKILMLYGGGSIFRNGVYAKVREALKDHEVNEFGGIEPNPSYETSMEALKIVKSKSIDFLLAVGGGSVIDAAKFIAAAALWENGDPWTIITGKEPVKAALPVGVILTLPATGSEMNKNSVMSRKSTIEKLAFSSVHSLPKFSVLLPDAAASLPRNQVANGIVDAFVHVIEQYMTYPADTPLQERFAEAILITLMEEGPKAYADPNDYNAMANLMWCATMALNGIIQCGVPDDWSIHRIGHELTALHGLDHAVTLAIVLPGQWKTLKEHKKEKLLQYAARVLKITEGSEDERISVAIEKTTEFFESLGIKTRLPDYGIQQETIDKVITRLKQRGWIKLGDRGLVTPLTARTILEDRL